MPYDRSKPYLEHVIDATVRHSSVQNLINKHLRNGVLTDRLFENHSRAPSHDPEQRRTANRYRFVLLPEWQSEETMLQRDAAKEMGLPDPFNHLLRRKRCDPRDKPATFGVHLPTGESYDVDMPPVNWTGESQVGQPEADPASEADRASQAATEPASQSEEGCTMV